VGLEPTHPFEQWILSPSRLPFRHAGIGTLLLLLIRIAGQELIFEQLGPVFAISKRLFRDLSGGIHCCRLASVHHVRYSAGMRKLFGLSICLLSLLTFLSAQATASPDVSPADFDLIMLLGYTPELTLVTLGAPARIRAVRGLEAWQDDVVFEYPDLKLALFFWEDRVWQLRADSGFSGSLAGQSLVPDYGQLEVIYGRTRAQGPTWQEWAVPGSAWPLRLRMVTDDGDNSVFFYIYRADF